jgi:hypothetical protein
MDAGYTRHTSSCLCVDFNSALPWASPSRALLTAFKFVPDEFVLAHPSHLLQ